MAKRFTVEPTIHKAAASYAEEIARLVSSGTTTEPTYYPAVRALLNAVLVSRDLPFEVRTNTSERKVNGGVNLPDIAFYDSNGTFLVVCGEVKLPSAAIEDLASSTDGKNQIGRYLAASGVVILCTVRSFGLLAIKGARGSGPVPPKARELIQTVELWPSLTALKRGDPISPHVLEELVDLVETAVTQHAPIAEPESLARILARQAKLSKHRLPQKFTQAVQGLLEDFGKALGITFEGEEGEEFFRSSLIQTVYYGLFAAWALWWQGGRAKPFHWEELGEYLRIPFLGSLFYEFRHPSRIKELKLANALDIATQTLARVNGELFFKRFQSPTLEHAEETTTAAILYFYEPFVQAFDPQLRKELGVWYTPGPIVRYQIARVDQILRQELGCPRGFADEKVVVLDPCCGTGAYLIEVLRYAADQLRSEGNEATLAAKLLHSVCQRFIGFEILTAPFVIAQLQIYLLLSRLGAEPDETHRPAIFLTNALTGWQGPDQIKLNFPELQEEHDAALLVKRKTKIIVVLGNPPYNRFAGVPLAEEADLVDTYKGIQRSPDGKQVGQSLLYTRFGVRKHLLDDLYIRFFRLADRLIGERAEYGIVSFISNSSYLTGRSHPIMRESLIEHFDSIWIDNLHGNRIASERTPWGASCETIFNTGEIGPGIKVGTAISTLVKYQASQRGGPASLHIRDFWGSAEHKRAALLESVALEPKSVADRPEGPHEYEEFRPSEKNAFLFARTKAGGYEEWPALDELFVKLIQGVNPNRGLNESVIDMRKDALETRMREYFSNISFEELRSRYPVLCEDRASFDARVTREKLRKSSGFDEHKIRPYLLFPLDARWLYYELNAQLLNRPRPELSDHLDDNEFLVGVPQARRPSESRPLLVPGLYDLHLHDWGSVGFPAESRSKAQEADLFHPGSSGASTQANIAGNVWAVLKSAWELKGDLHGWDAKRLCRKLFRYAIAIAHTPQYESDHRESLAQGWPRIPLTKSVEVFENVVRLGTELAALLDPLSEPAEGLRKRLGPDVKTLAIVASSGGGSVKEADLTLKYSYYGAAPGRWEERSPDPKEATRPEWGVKTGDLYLNETVFLRNVPPEVWRYELGGYPVIKKWLGYRDAGRRPGWPLSLQELDQLRSSILRISAVLLLRPHLDAVYKTAIAEAWTLDELNAGTSIPP